MLEAPQILPKINSTMRKARGNLNQLTGYFHVENSLGDDVPRFTKAKSRAYCAMMFEEAEAAGLEIAFWHFHPCGFGLLLHNHGEDRLRAWAAKRRGAFRRGRMPQWQLDALAGTTVLEPINSSDTPAPPSAAWLRHYKALQHFHRQHGHTRVKRTDPHNKTLANWVWTQRAEARKGNLHPEKRRLLDRLGFDWNPRKAQKATRS